MTARHRSRWPWLAPLLAGALLLGACGSDGDGSGATTTAASSPVPSSASVTTAAVSAAPASAAPSTAPAADAFPVTIEHTFGSTTIESAPKRVVSIGFTDHEPLLALGVEPVAIRHWYGDFEYVWPWADEALGDQRPVVLPDTDLNFEQIAALHPDLIIGLYIGLEQDEYDKLSAIAPTIAQPAGYPSFGAPWQEITRIAGRAVGKSAEAEALVDQTEALFTAARSAHPEFAGVGLAYAGVYGTDTPNFYVETDGSTRMAVLQDLGFVVPDELAALGTDSFYHDISAERLDLLEQDVVLWEPAIPELLPQVQTNPIYQTLAVAEEGRDIFMTDPLVAAAMAHSTVLSLPVVLNWLVPELARAVGN